MTATDIIAIANSISNALLKQNLRPEEIIAVLETTKTAVVQQGFLDQLARAEAAQQAKAQTAQRQ